MDPISAAGIGVGGSVGLVAIIKIIKRFLGFKSCKYHSNSNNDECIFGCKATKRIKKKKNITESDSNDSLKPPSILSNLSL